MHGADVNEEERRRMKIDYTVKVEEKYTPFTTIGIPTVNSMYCTVDT